MERQRARGDRGQGEGLVVIGITMRPKTAGLQTMVCGSQGHHRTVSVEGPARATTTRWQAPLGAKVERYCGQSTRSEVAAKRKPQAHFAGIAISSRVALEEETTEGKERRGSQSARPSPLWSSYRGTVPPADSR